jgi:hypothetical protein
MLVDLGGRDHNGYEVEAMVNPEHISSLVDQSGSYYSYTDINLVGGQKVRVPHRPYEVKRRIDAALHPEPDPNEPNPGMTVQR